MKKVSGPQKLLIIFPIFIGLFFVLSPSPSGATDGYVVEIALPGMGDTTSFSDPGAYIKILFIFGLSLAGFLAVGAIAWAGIQYMVAGASSMTSIEKAKEQIRGALMGIILLLCAWLILSTIDPTLTNLTPTIESVGEIGSPTPMLTATPTPCPTTPCSPSVYVRDEFCNCVPDTSIN